MEDNDADIIDIHSVDIVINNYTSYIIKNTEKIHFGIFAHTDILFPNPFFKETSHFVIYDFSMRIDTIIGPFIRIFPGKRLEPYFGIGLNFLETVITHNEKTAYNGDIHYERFGFNMGIGINTGLEIHFNKLFLNLGGVFNYEFLNYTSFKSKFGDYAGFTNGYKMFEIRPYLSIGFYLAGRKSNENI